MSAPIRKILLTRLDHMGDAILMTPMLDALLRCYSDAKVTCLVSSRTFPVFENDPRIDQLVTFDLHEASRAEKRQMAVWVREQGFDLVISLTEKFWAAMWSLYSGAPVRIGFDVGISQLLKKLWRRPSFNYRIRSSNDPFVASPFHEVQRYMSLLQPLGISETAGPLTVSTDTAAKVWAEEKWAALNLPQDSIPIGFHFSELWGGDGWPQTLQGQIIHSLLAKDSRIVVIGTAGPGEETLLDKLVATLPGERFHLFQGMNFSQWIEIVRHLRAYISFETGSAHIGAAAGIPTLMVFPDRWFAHRSTRWHPWGVPYRVLQRPLPQTAAAGKFPQDVVETVWELI